MKKRKKVGDKAEFRKVLKKVHKEFIESHVYIELKNDEFQLLKEVFSVACQHVNDEKAIDYASLLGKIVIQAITI